MSLKNGLLTWSGISILTRGCAGAGSGALTRFRHTMVRVETLSGEVPFYRGFTVIATGLFYVAP